MPLCDPPFKSPKTGKIYQNKKVKKRIGARKFSISDSACTRNKNRNTTQKRQTYPGKKKCSDFPKAKQNK